MDMRSFEEKICDIRFCRSCSISSLKRWKGWPIRDPLPLLPLIENGKCKICGGTNDLLSMNIIWLNIHGPYNTGLPDYWILKINEGKTFKKKFISKWGLPYYKFETCKRCGGLLLVSIFNPPIGWQLKKQCMKSLLSGTLIE
jgi:hypothetical protein